MKLARPQKWSVVSFLRTWFGESDLKFSPPVVAAVIGLFGLLAVQLSTSQDERDRFAMTLRHEDQMVAVEHLRELSRASAAPLTRSVIAFEAIRARAPDSTVVRMRKEFFDEFARWRVTRAEQEPFVRMLFGDSISRDLDRIDSALVLADGWLGEYEENVREVRRMRASARSSPEVAGEIREFLRLSAKLDSATFSSAQHSRIAAQSSFQYWLALVAARRTGSLDPLARYTIPPAAEERMEARRRAREAAEAALKMDSTASAEGEEQ